MRSVLSPFQIRPLLTGASFLFAELLLAIGYVQSDNLVFLLAMLILAAFAIISSGALRAQREEELIEQQKKTAWMLVRRDLELTRANDNLRQLDQMKTDFVSVVTHQLRTPLSAIRWTISMLLNGDFGRLTDEQRTFLMKAYESNNRMVTLIKDMVFVDHLESGKLKSSPEMMTSLPDLLDNLLLEFYPMAENRHVKLVFRRPDSSYPMVRIDPANMRAVMQNLIENALKYTPAGGSVTLTFGNDASGALLFSVADTGIGIPEAEQPRIFKRFYRASNAQKKETDGSGLGLFIAKRIMQKCQGDIWFESTENAGTTFHVRLPVASDAPQSADSQYT